MSRTFSISNGSFDSLKVSLRWLQSKRAPDLIHGRATQAARLRHVADAPVRRPARRLFQRAHDHLLNLLITDPARRARTRLVIQPIQSMANKPSPPFTDRGLRHPQSFRHHRVVVSVCQHDPRAARGGGPCGIDEPTSRVARVRLLSESAPLSDVPVAYSPPCRRVRPSRAIYFTFFAVRTLGVLTGRSMTV